MSGTYGITLSLTPTEAASISTQSSTRLQNLTKLNLVLDLDHTLLHATADYLIKTKFAHLLQKKDVRTLILPMMEEEVEEDDIAVMNGERRGGGVSMQMQMQQLLPHYIKLRPHLSTFLTTLLPLYEINVYTAGTRSYANHICNVICRHLVGSEKDEEDLRILERQKRELEERVRWFRVRKKRREVLRKMMACRKEKEKKVEGKGKKVGFALEKGEQKEDNEAKMEEEKEGEKMDVVQEERKEEKKVGFSVEKEESSKPEKKEEEEEEMGVVTDDDSPPPSSNPEQNDEKKPKTEQKEEKQSTANSKNDGVVDLVIDKKEKTTEETSEQQQQDKKDNNEATTPLMSETIPKTTEKKRKRVTFGDDDDDDDGADSDAKKTKSSQDNVNEKKMVNDEKKIESKKDITISTPIPRKRLPKETNESTSENDTSTSVSSSSSSSSSEEEEKDPSSDLEQITAQYNAAMKLEEEAMELRKKIFGSRILSRTDVGDLGREVKSLKRMFPCGGTMAAIVDDREDVWANAENNNTGRPGEPPENLLLVKPYHWKPFSGCRDVNNAAGVDISASSSSSSSSNDGSKQKSDAEKEKENSEDSKKEEQTECQLLWTMDILKRVHERYYSNAISNEERQTLSVPQIVKEMRRSVFGGGNGERKLKILLSGLVPLHRQSSIGENVDDSKPRPSVVRYAEELGATLVSEPTPDITHVVAARDGTEKVLRARRIAPHAFVVRASWLMECYWSITMRDVGPHMIGPMPTVKPPPPPPPQSLQNKNNRSTTSEKKKSILLIGSDSSDGEENAGTSKTTTTTTIAPGSKPVLLTGTDSSDDDDDDDFAAELENEIMANGGT